MPLTTVDVSRLAAELELGSSELVSIVGGGGKTTTLFGLGRSLGPRVVMTTTTKMGVDRTDGHPVLVNPSDPQLRAALDRHDRVLVWRQLGGHRADGIDPADCDRWHRDAVADHVLVEADGSRRRPFKAPYPYEPVVPAATTMLVACIGVDALDRPIGQVCHRPDAVVAIADGSLDDPLTPERAARVLLSDEGSRRGLPPGARYAVLVHRVGQRDRAAAHRLIEALDGAVPVIAVEPVGPRPMTGRHSAIG